MLAPAGWVVGAQRGMAGLHAWRSDLQKGTRQLIRGADIAAPYLTGVTGHCASHIMDALFISFSCGLIVPETLMVVNMAVCFPCLHHDESRCLEQFSGQYRSNAIPVLDFRSYLARIE